MKKLFSTLLLILSMTTTVFAEQYDAEINGLWYSVETVSKEALVIQNKNENEFYSGDIVIPDAILCDGANYSVSGISTSAFYGCSNLTSISIPNSVRTIAEYAFRGCKSLKSITIPSSITRIGENAFQECWGLTSVQITNLEAWCRINFRNVDSNPLFYAHHIFLNGDEIENLYIPNTVTGIENYAFYNCQGLVSISIPSSVTRISKNAFLGCTGLTSITIPGSVINIGEAAFAACEKLTTVIIEEGVASIGKSAFYDCTALQSITIPNSVTDIWDYTFMYCSSLTSFTISNNIKSIRDYAFYKCGGLTEITLGNGLEKIYPYAFAACSKLSDVYCYAEKVPVMMDIDDNLHTNAFARSPIENATLHVPTASVEAYKSTEPWKNFKSIVSIDGDAPETKKCATPTISFENGEITFGCDTEGVEYVYGVFAPETKSYNEGKLILSNTYKISVYAKKSGYENSDVATKEINISSRGNSGIAGDLNNDGVTNAADVVKLTNIIMNQK